MPSKHPLLELQVNEPLSPEPQAPQQERPLTPFLDEQAQQQEQDQPAPSSFSSSYYYYSLVKGSLEKPRNINPYWSQNPDHAPTPPASKRRRVQAPTATTNIVAPQQAQSQCTLAASETAIAIATVANAAGISIVLQ